MYITLLTIQAASVFVLFAESLYVFMKMKTEIHKYLFLHCVAILINNIGYFLEMTSDSAEEYLRGIKVSYIGKVWIVYSLFVFLMLVCHKKINYWTKTALVTIHVFILFLVEFCEWTPLYYKSFTYVEEGVLFPYLKSEGGIFHILYDLVIIGYIVVGLFNLIKHIIQTKNSADKKRLIFFLLAVLANVIGYFVHLAADSTGYDFTNLGFAVGSIFMGIAIFNYNLLDTLQLFKDYVVDKLPEAIIAVNDAGTIDFSNKVADQIIGEFGNDQKKFVATIKQHIEEQKPLKVGERIYAPEETLINDERVAHGEIYVLVDETERYKYMDELSLQKEIAEKANTSKSRFLSVVSHEIRTPMNAVVSMTNLLLSEPEKLDDTQRRYLKNMRNSGESLVMIVNDILDLSKIEAGKMELIESIYNIYDTVDEVKLIIESRLGNKKLEIITEISDEVPKTLYGDVLRIRQILINIMNNAVKYTEKGYVKLNISVIDREEDVYKLRFSIKDSGQGIRKEDLGKLGEDFAQVDVVTNHLKEGTGLGLSISSDFISMMGGALKISSEYGKGSEFFFEIKQGTKEGADCKKGETVSDSLENFEGKKVLVVDDTEINLMIAEALLTKLNIEVDTATLGTDAIELVKNNRYDLIFMDYIMPHMSGIETTAKIRNLADVYAVKDGEKADYLRKVKIIALTADDSDETKKQFMKAGVSGFTDKPIDIEKIMKWL